MDTLYYGDNLEILRKYIPDDSVDLIYLDPPFNSKADYNILFKETTGTKSHAQMTAFEDSWHWTEETERSFEEIVDNAPASIVEMMTAFKQFIGNNDMMAYLTMMCVRLVELKRVLKETGSIYLHCDPTASHYLKIVMDTIFGKKNFRNEIVWRRTNAKGLAFSGYPKDHDILLYYVKSEKFRWNRPFAEYDEKYLEAFYRYVEEGTGRRYRLSDLTNPNVNRPNLTYEWKGHTKVWRWTKERMEEADKKGLIHYSSTGLACQKRYLDEMKGRAVDSIWDDIPPIQAQSLERLGYQTQKPEALLERIITVSSDEGDLVLDPFCGCGTAVTVSQRLKRQWIGIDITHLAINLIKGRLQDRFGLQARKDYTVIGEPEDAEGARELASQNRYQFQWWALSLINARPYGDKKKGADTGIDGYVYFSDEKGKTKRAIVQVKSGNTSVKDVRDLGHVIDREKSEIGILFTLEKPTSSMTKEAVLKGFYKSDTWNKQYARIQILTIEEVLSGKQPSLPPTISPYKQAQKATQGHQLELI